MTSNIHVNPAALVFQEFRLLHNSTELGAISDYCECPLGIRSLENTFQKVKHAIFLSSFLMEKANEITH